MPRPLSVPSPGRDARLGRQVSISRGPVSGDPVTLPVGVGADARVWTPAKFAKTVIGAGTKIDELRQRAAVRKLPAFDEASIPVPACRGG